MRIVLVSNFINHHQISVADKLFATEGIEYHFIETEPMPIQMIKSGYPDYSDREYLCKTYLNLEQMKYARSLIDEADVVIIGAAPEKWVHKRLKNNKVTFHYNERWFKRGYLSLLSPKILYNLYMNHIRFRKKRSYMLCASAFTASDCKKVFSYINKCYKWGYFTKIENLNINEILEKKRNPSIIKIMYVSRFLDWKHPELPVYAAHKLKNSGVRFELNMYGSGEKLNYIKNLIHDLELDNFCFLKGNLPNDKIREEMQRHHIFLFTSGRYEGWGAVLNEAMSNGCMVIASNKIGSVPFLLKNNINGLIFKDQDIESLYQNLIYAIDNELMREEMAREAYKTMSKEWSPDNATNALIKLAKSALNYDITPLKEGPCSVAK